MDQLAAYPDYEFNIWLCEEHHLLSTPIVPRITVQSRLTRFNITNMEAEQIPAVEPAEEAVASVPEEKEIEAPKEEVVEPETI